MKRLDLNYWRELFDDYPERKIDEERYVIGWDVLQSDELWAQVKRDESMLHAVDAIGRWL
jgi:hypothetical protein